MNEDYNDFKKMFDNNDDYTDYKAKSVQYLDEDYKKTGVYNGVNIREDAQKDAEAISSKYRNEKGQFLVLSSGDCEVKVKQIPSEKNSKLKKVFAIFAIAGILSSSVVVGADVLNHPENYDSTYDKFEGAPTVSEIIERTPDNFNIR